MKPYQKDNPALIHLDPYMSVYFYRMNVTQAPFTDKRVRQAFSMAIDREEVARNVLKSGERPAYFYTPPDTARYTCASQVAHDPERARALLAEAGFEAPECYGHLSGTPYDQKARRLVVLARNGS